MNLKLINQINFESYVTKIGKEEVEPKFKFGSVSGHREVSGCQVSDLAENINNLYLLSSDKIRT